MKIIFSSCKEMNLCDLIKKENTINLEEVYSNINFIKSVSQTESNIVFKTKESIYELHQNINVLSKRAIDLYSGLSFRQIEDKNHYSLNNVLILSSLYGYSNPFDYISFYRYDYSMKNSKLNRKLIYKQINELLKDEDFIINLASKEFSNGIVHENIIEFEFLIYENNKYTQKSALSKKMRGQVLNFLLDYSLDKIDSFTYDGFIFDKNKSLNNKYIFVKTM